MSSSIWNIGQETKAQDLYNDTKENGLKGCRLIRGEVNAVKQLTQICNAMAEAYNEVIDDQNEYLIEVEAEASEFEALKEDINEKLKQLYAEVKELEKKEQNGTITEEEQQELETKKGELNSLMQDSDNKVKEKSDSAKANGEERIQKHKSKEEIAKNYGETTVEKGTPLAGVEVKTKSFWRSIFGGTNKDKKEAGDKAVEAGNNLLDKVDVSADISNKIDKHYKSFKTK